MLSTRIELEFNGDAYNSTVPLVLFCDKVRMTIDDQLKTVLIERLFLDLSIDQIDAEAPLADYGIDSFLLLELVVGIEEMFEVRFQQSDINADTLRSIASLRECVMAKRRDG